MGSGILAWEIWKNMGNVHSKDCEVLGSLQGWICKISSRTNTLAPEVAYIFICCHLNHVADARLHGKLTDFGNFTACK